MKTADDFDDAALRATIETECAEPDYVLGGSRGNTYVVFRCRNTDAMVGRLRRLGYGVGQVEQAELAEHAGLCRVRVWQLAGEHTCPICGELCGSLSRHEECGIPG